MKRRAWFFPFVLAFYVLSSWGQGGHVIRMDREWLQPNDFNEISYSQVNAVCPNGVCSGSLSGFDLTGFNWASTQDVQELFDDYENSGKAILLDFTPTSPSAGIDPAFLWGIVSDMPPNNRSFYTALIAGDDKYDPGSGEPPRQTLENSYLIEVNESLDEPFSGGAWFYREFRYKQKQFVFSIPESLPIAAQDECDLGVADLSRFRIQDINPNVTAKYQLSAIRTWNATGKVLDQDVNEVGEILVCQDWQTYWPERNLIPVYYEITIGGRTYRAVGAGTSPKYTEYDVLPGGGQVMVPENYPEPGVTFLNYTATVLPASDDKVGGIFFIGNLGYVDGIDRSYFDHGSIGVLQLIIPTRNN